MLCNNVRPFPLSPKRHLHFSNDLNQIMKGNDSCEWLYSIGATLGIIFTLAFKPRNHIFIHPVSCKWIQKQKDIWKQESTVSFVSTNDVLTSWIFNSCKCDIGFMAINFRNRIKALQDLDAGNYEALVAYQPCDYLEPQLIRKSISDNSCCHRVNREVALPSFLKSLSSRICVVSTWVTFFKEINLLNCRHIYHLPFVSTKPIPFEDIFIFFKSNDQEIKVLSMTRSLNDINLQQLGCV